MNDRLYVAPVLTETWSIYLVSDRTVGPVESVVVLKATPLVELTELETLLRKLPVELVDPVEAVGEIPLVELTALGAFLRMLLLSVPAQAPLPRLVPGEMKSMRKRLLLLALVPSATPRSVVTVQENGIVASVTAGNTDVGSPAESYYGL